MNPPKLGRWVFVMALFWATGASPTDPLEVDVSGAEPAVARAVTAAVSAVRVDAEDAGAWAELGQLLHVHGMRSEAVSSYARAMALAPQDYRWPYLAFTASDDPPAALRFAARAYALQPDDYALAIAYEDSLTRQGQPNLARDVYLEARSAAGDRGYASVGLARLALASGELKKARALLDEAHDAVPENGEVHQLLAQILHREGAVIAATRAGLRARAYTGRTQPASDVLDAMRAFAESTSALQDLGARLLAKGEHAAARKALEAARKRASRPSLFTVRRLAEVALAEKSPERALNLLADAVRRWPHDAALLTDLAQTRRRLGNVEAARRDVATVLDRHPDDARALRLLGSIETELGNDAGAVPLLEQALANDPTLYGAYADLALACERSGDATRALAARERLHLLSPGRLDNRIRLAGLLFAQGARDRAIRTLRDVLEEAKGHPEASFDLATLLVLDGSNPDEATEGLRLARVVYARNRRSARHAYLMSRAQAANEQPAPAIQTARRALTLAMGDEALEARRPPNAVD